MKAFLYGLALLWATLLAFVPIIAHADDDYEAWTVSAIDTAPTDCSLADGCAKFKGVSCVYVTNTGASAIHIGLDKDESQGVAWDVSTGAPLAAGAAREICSSKAGSIDKVFLKTASGTSTATVEGVR